MTCFCLMIKFLPIALLAPLQLRQEINGRKVTREVHSEQSDPLYMGYQPNNDIHVTLAGSYTFQCNGHLRSWRFTVLLVCLWIDIDHRVSAR